MDIGKLFEPIDFIAELTIHIPPKHKHLGNPPDCLYYGLYSSRTKGKARKDGDLAQFGYNPTPAYEGAPDQASDYSVESISTKASRQSWARLIQKVYEWIL